MSYRYRRSSVGEEITSEMVQRKLAYRFANRKNVLGRLFKTKEEKEELRKLKSEHKNALIQHYGKDYNRRKIFNLPQYSYGTITSE